MKYALLFILGGVAGGIYGTILTMRSYEDLQKPVPVIPDPLNLKMEDLPARLDALQDRCPEGTEGSIINNGGKLALLCEYPAS